MTCRCKERGDTLRRMPSDLVRGDILRVGQGLKMVARTSLEDARSVAVKAMSADRRIKR